MTAMVVMKKVLFFTLFICNSQTKVYLEGCHSHDASIIYHKWQIASPSYLFLCTVQRTAKKEELCPIPSNHESCFRKASYSSEKAFICISKPLLPHFNCSCKITKNNNKKNHSAMHAGEHGMTHAVCFNVIG